MNLRQTRLYLAVNLKYLILIDEYRPDLQIRPESRKLVCRRRNLNLCLIKISQMVQILVNFPFEKVWMVQICDF